ncbi:MAG: class I adenylate-forming enzyme family protein [Candidatus Binatia bacterium]
MALQTDGRDYTYAGLADASARLGAALLARGLRPGDRVALFLPNGAELAMAYFGCFAAGLVAVPLNPRYQGPEVDHAVGDCAPRLLIADVARLDRLDGTRLAARGVADVFAVGSRPPAGAQPFATLLDTPPLAAPHAVTERAPAVILYTSGSTGRPKGVTHTHGSLRRTAEHQIVSQALGAGDVQLAWMGIAYIAAFAGQLLTALRLGGRLALLPSFEPAAAIAAIARHGATRLQSGPADLRDLLDHSRPPPAMLATLRCCLAGGEQIDAALHERFAAWAGFALTEVCGMTEAYNYAMNPPFGRKRPGSIGLPTDGVELRLTAADGRDADEGEILVRSDATAIGYWNDPAATAATWRDGWLITGDLARRDPDGWYWFVGRRKQIIIRGASNIAPGEVEAALLLHPAVAAAGVVGAPDPHDGHVPVAFVQPRPGAALDVAALRAFAAERLAAYKVPVSITVLDALPLNVNGKVDRSALAARVRVPP